MVINHRKIQNYTLHTISPIFNVADQIFKRSEVWIKITTRYKDFRLNIIWVNYQFYCIMIIWFKYFFLLKANYYSNAVIRFGLVFAGSHECIILFYCAVHSTFKIISADSIPLGPLKVISSKKHSIKKM